MVNRKGCKTDLYIFLSPQVSCSSWISVIIWGMSTTVPNFEAKKPLPAPRPSSRTWRWPPGTGTLLHAALRNGSADHLPRPQEQTNAWLGKWPHLIFCRATTETPLSTACVATVFMILYQPGSLSSKVSDKDKTKHFSPCFLSHKSSQGPQDTSSSMPEGDYPEQVLRAHEIFPALSPTQPISLGRSEDCQISLKALQPPSHKRNQHTVS